MNILLDTNIIIPLEDTSRILDAPFAELRKLAAEQQHCLYVHPLQIDDINRDKTRKESVMAQSTEAGLELPSFEENCGGVTVRIPRAKVTENPQATLQVTPPPS